jgi:hypothetical protein
MPLQQTWHTVALAWIYRKIDPENIGSDERIFGAY